MLPIVDRMVLGTAQFGLDYGIVNHEGKPNRKQVFDVLSLAWDSGITRFDTAPDYGSEKIIGEFIKAHGISDVVKVLTKIPKVHDPNRFQEHIDRSVENSIRMLGAPIDVLFFHSVTDVSLFAKNSSYFETLLIENPISIIGASVYDPSETNSLIDSDKDFAFQFPLSIVDDRFNQLDLRPGHRYARSIFLQGVLSSKKGLRLQRIEELKKFHKDYHNCLVEHCINPIELALTFVGLSPAADFFLIGVASKDQLNEVIEAKFLKSSDMKKIASYLPNLRLDLRDPRNW